MYSDLYFQSKRKQPILLIIMAVAAVGMFIVFLTSTKSSIPTRASKKTLARHNVANVGAHQAGIFWKSDQLETGWIIYGDSPQKLNTVALDERDVESKKRSSLYHYVLLSNLKENTTYYYKVVSGAELVTQNGSGEPFTFKTLATASNPSSQKPAYGKIVTANGQAAPETFVIITYKNSYPLITMTKLTGEWLIPLQSIVDRKTGATLTLLSDDRVDIEVVSDEQETARIEAIIQNITPLPQTIVMGKTYTFISDSDVLPASSAVYQTGSKHPVTILFPKEGSVIPGYRPLIKGQGVPNKQLKLSINSNPGYVFQLTADAKGEWAVTSPVTIGPGSYTMTLKTVDDGGKSVQLSRRFVIGKSGEAVLGDATPSGTVTDTPTPTIDPALTITTTPLPTLTTTPTATPVSGTITATPKPPTSGFNSNAVLYGSAALIILGAGIMFVF